MKDAFGISYANISLKAGDTIKVDDGFTCIKKWTTHIVQENESGLFIKCKDGNHYLDGQLNEKFYVGIYKQ